MVDLRSDTVTRPTPAMRQAMAGAEVGDDVFGEDPTVLRLQEQVAELLGKEKALFVPSGSMGNQLALRVQSEPGDEVICEANAHIVHYEAGGSAVLSGVQLRPLTGERGVLSPEQVESAVRAGYYWEPRSRIVALENTNNKAGGTIYPHEVTLKIAGVARGHGLSLHLDGARLWNASVASGRAPEELAAPFDSVSVCLSKGLGAPVGSLIVGSRELIEKALRWRKLFGGGMRQVGILAAAGLHALDHHLADLHLDHERAARLALAIADIDGLSIDAAAVQTNIVMFETGARPALAVLEALKAAGVLMVPFGPTTIRATTHRDLDDADIDTAIASLQSVFAA